jgi:hypothetical protein
MFRTQVFLRCTHLDLESARTTILDRRGRWSKGQTAKFSGSTSRKGKVGEATWLTGLWRPGFSVRAGGMKKWVEWKEKIDGGVSHLSKKVRQRERVIILIFVQVQKGLRNTEL